MLDLTARSRTADVERTHGELRARLTDGLSADDTDGLSDVHLVPAAEVSAVTHHAYAATVLAGQDRANQHALDTGRFDAGHTGLVDLLVGFDERFVGDGIGDVLERNSTENALAERRNDLAALFELADPNAVECLAVVVGDDGVLRHIDETPASGNRSLPSSSAVSARPLRAPCVEMKYCKTVSPSRKFAVMGVSMISPDGLAIRPRMPAS